MPYGIPGVPLLSPDAGPVPPVPLQQPQNLFRFGEQTIWSTLFHKASEALASSTHRLFSVAQGGTGQGFVESISIAETNLKEGGRIPAGVAYDVFGVACQVMHSGQTTDSSTNFNIPADSQGLIKDLVNIQSNGVLSWDFTQTVVDICPILLAGAGGGAFGAVSSNAAQANSGQMNNGNGSIWMYRKHPVALPGNSTFSIVIRYGSRAAAIGASNSVGVRVVLLGYYKNVIEIG